MPRWSIICVVWIGISQFAAFATVAPDEWLTNAVAYPTGLSAIAPASRDAFAMRAEVIADTLQVTCSMKVPADTVALYISADPPGHWTARDWRPLSMANRGTSWVGIVPVDNVHVPVAYFVRAVHGSVTNVSPVRVCSPGQLGLELPTRYFWSFLDGFESGTENWRVLGTNGVIATSAEARTGKAALQVNIPTQRREIIIGTTRLRGWYAEEFGARGLGVWIRTRGGTGQASGVLVAEAFSAHQVAQPGPESITVTDRWQRMELPLTSHTRGFAIGDIDFVRLTLRGAEGTQFLIDDLHLIGHWRPD